MAAALLWNPACGPEWLEPCVSYVFQSRVIYQCLRISLKTTVPCSHASQDERLETPPIQEGWEGSQKSCLWDYGHHVSGIFDVDVEL